MTQHNADELAGRAHSVVEDWLTVCKLTPELTLSQSEALQSLIVDALRHPQQPQGRVVSDEMILTFIKASDSQGFGAEKGSFLWEQTEKGLREALAALPSPVAEDNFVKALKPFAEAAHNYADCTDEKYIDEDATVSVGNLRAARAALADLSSATPDEQRFRHVSPVAQSELSEIIEKYGRIENQGQFAFEMLMRDLRRLTASQSPEQRGPQSK